MPSHYLNQCWNIVNWALRNKFQWNFDENTTIFIQENDLLPSGKWRPFCLSLNVLIHGCIYLKAQQEAVEISKIILNCIIRWRKDHVNLFKKWLISYFKFFTIFYLLYWAMYLWLLWSIWYQSAPICKIDTDNMIFIITSLIEFPVFELMFPNSPVNRFRFTATDFLMRHSSDPRISSSEFVCEIDRLGLSWWGNYWLKISPAISGILETCFSEWNIGKEIHWISIPQGYQMLCLEISLMNRGWDKMATIMHQFSFSSIKIVEFWFKFHSLKFISKGPSNHMPTLVQITAWHQTGAKPLSEPMMV